MRKMIMMALAGFLLRKFRSRLSRRTYTTAARPMRR